MAGWGVETTDGISKPPAENFPLNRYNEYPALLKEVGGVGVSRGEGATPESVGVLVYASGFRGDTRYIEVIWIDHQPTRMMAGLDDFYETSKPRTPVYKHIDGNWYLWADW